MRINLTKKDLINQVYMQIGFSKQISENLIEEFFSLIISNIKNEKKLKISNFGTFSIRLKKSRIGRNPKTKEEKTISQRNVVLFKPSKEFKKFINLINKDHECNFYLATGKNEEEQIILKDILSSHKDLCVALDNYSISEILPIIKSCRISICNDSSFSHLSAALSIPTIVLMSDTPLLYGSYSPNMYPIVPDGIENVSHNSRGKEKINPEKIYNKFKSIIS